MRIFEERRTAAGGAKELIVIAQDITKYGLDLYNEGRLVLLLKDMCAIDGVNGSDCTTQTRTGLDDFELVARGKDCQISDIPIQHISDK